MVTRTYYDSANRPVTTVQNLVGQDIYVNTPPARGSAGADENVRTDIAYDSFGRRDTATDPLGRVTKYDYNELGQLIKVTANFVNGGVPQNDGNERNILTAYEYDTLGRQVKITDTLGRVSLSAYDNLGRVTASTQNYLPGQPQNYKDASGNQYNLITAFTYDVRGNQIAVTDTKSIVTRTYYDSLGRTITVVRNLVGHDVSYPFPPVRSNPPGSTANLRTDAFYLGTGSVDFVVDEMGETTDYSYDALGRLLTLLDPLSNPTNFGYDANSNRTSMTDAEGVVTRYEYDALNRLKVVVENYRAGVALDHETNVRTEYTYDANGNRLSIRDGNSLLDGIDYRSTFTYDAFGRIKTESDPLGNTWIHEYDAMGNRVSLLDANGLATLFGYDELNRLELIDYPSPDANVVFEYDAFGRRISLTDGLGTTTWTYTNIDQPNSITDPFSAQVTYDYDALGNRTELSQAGKVFISVAWNWFSKR